MPPSDKKLEKLHKLLELANEDFATPDELIQMSEGLLSVVMSERKGLEKSINKQKDEVNTKLTDLAQSLNQTETALRGVIYKLEAKTKDVADEAATSLTKAIKKLEGKIPSRTDLSGLEAEIKAIQAALVTVPTEITANPEAVRDALELLQDEHRLDKSAIKGLDDYDELVALAREPRTAQVAGARLLRYLADVSIDSITNGQTLVWNSTTGRFEPGSASGSGHIIEDEGTPLTQRATLDFVGAGVTVTDVGAKTTVTIPGGGGGGDMVLASAQTNTGLKTFLDATLGLRNVANTITSFFTNAATVARTWTFPDKNGTVAMTSDITGVNSGTNTGDQTITLTGGVTGSGTGSFAATVATNANLTGPVTSLGNATAIADAALSIAKTSGLQAALDAKEAVASKDATGGYAGLTLFRINFKNAANTFTNFLTNTTTAARTYTFPDKDITVAGLVDITGTNSGTNTGDNAVNTLYSGLVSNATHTGDATGATALTLATVNSNVGSFGLAASVAQFTVNAKGLITAAANVAISITSSAVTDFAATVRSTVLTGLSLVSVTIISATDTVLVALGSLQAQITALTTTVSGKVDSTRTISTTAPLSGGGDLSANRTLTTSMATNKLIGRSTAGTGVMEEITLGTNLSFTGTTLNSAGGGSNTYVNTVYTDQSGGTADTYGVLAGTINGSNAVFTVSQAAYATTTLLVWLNGQLMTQGTGEDFVETLPASGTFTFNTAPATGSLITVTYQRTNTTSSTLMYSRQIANIAINTTAGAVANTDYVYFCTATLTLTLPTVAGNTNRYTVKSVAGVTTIACNGAQTIDGTATIVVQVEDSVDLISNGTEWKVV